MTERVRYSRWDGSQADSPLDADALLKGLTDDLMSFGDLQHSLRNMLQRGLRPAGQPPLDGLRDILQRLRQHRRDMLEQFNLQSVFEDLQGKIDEIIDLERAALEDRLAGLESEEQGSGTRASSSPPAEPEPKPAADAGASSPDEDGAADPREEFGGMLRKIVQQKQAALDDLPPDAAGRMRELQRYEFMDPEARRKFQELLDSLKQALVESFFKNLSQQLQDMSPDDLQRLEEMVRDLNEMLRQRMVGEEPDFDAFMEKHGDLFGDDPPRSLDELMELMQQRAAQMQNLLDSLPGEARDQLQGMLGGMIGGSDLEADLAELAGNLEQLYPMRDLRNRYPFRGDEELDLQGAMTLMDEMQGLDELERQIEHTQYGGDLDDVDADRLEALLGEEAREKLDQLKSLIAILEDAGYIRKRGNSWELTPRGTRRIGQAALAEIYANLKLESFGNHPLVQHGRSGERADRTKRYEFGDPFHIHLESTVMNSIFREGPKLPVELAPDDFEVYRAELLTQTATVLMLDLSWSMALRGSFQSAKKVALALNNLIRTRYPRDNLYLVGFSAYARELKQEQLPYTRWDETVLGTNMHHALIIAQTMLAKHTVGSRQIIMISDGEPTAHLEHGRSYFAYPPSPVTIRETLKEVKRCTKKDIVINTFMLDRNFHLKEFVNSMAKINKGRVFYTTPDKLGEYVLVDFVANRRRTLRGA